MSLPLSEFYEALRDYLLSSEIDSEDTLQGYSTLEINQAEQEYGIRFPEAYQLFLEKFARGNASFFDYQDYHLEGLADAKEVSQRLAASYGIELRDWFAFTQWQDGSYYAFKKVTKNPEVMLVAEGDEGIIIRNYSSFTSWLIRRLEGHLKLFVELRKPNAEKQLAQFQELKRLLVK